jgi:hypothetical protein
VLTFVAVADYKIVELIDFVTGPVTAVEGDAADFVGGAVLDVFVS